jgi:hypothetical protein
MVVDAAEAYVLEFMNDTCNTTPADHKLSEYPEYTTVPPSVIMALKPTVPTLPVVLHRGIWFETEAQRDIFLSRSDVHQPRITSWSYSKSVAAGYAADGAWSVLLTATFPSESVLVDITRTRLPKLFGLKCEEVITFPGSYSCAREELQNETP